MDEVRTALLEPDCRTLFLDVETPFPRLFEVDGSPFSSSDVISAASSPEDSASLTIASSLRPSPPSDNRNRRRQNFDAL
jgi:hypothetical protein